MEATTGEPRPPRGARQNRRRVEQPAAARRDRRRAASDAPPVPGRRPRATTVARRSARKLSRSRLVKFGAHRRASLIGLCRACVGVAIARIPAVISTSTRQRSRARQRSSTSCALRRPSAVGRPEHEEAGPASRRRACAARRRRTRRPTRVPRARSRIVAGGRPATPGHAPTASPAPRPARASRNDEGDARAPSSLPSSSRDRPVSGTGTVCSTALSRSAGRTRHDAGPTRTSAARQRGRARGPHSRRTRSSPDAGRNDFLACASAYVPSPTRA